MKRTYKNRIWETLACGLALAGLPGCNDSFLDQYPETSITAEAFFSTPEDLELYTNSFYTYLSDPVNDRGSDNVIAINSDKDDAYMMMRGAINPETVAQWSSYWKNLRNINFMLDHVGAVKGDTAEIAHYVGIARFFRAFFYYDMVKRYSDVPWYSHALKTTDTEDLYKTQDPRAVVVDSVMADLDYAVAHIKPDIDGVVSHTRVTRWTALAGLARIALQEGSWRKYHPELGLDDADRFFQAAAEAARQIMDGGKFSLYTTDNPSADRQMAYEALFNSNDLSTNPEMIMFRDYDKDLKVNNTKKTVFNENTGLSRDLLEDYLAIDADGRLVPFHEIPGYRTMGFAETFKNRDPRLNYTFMQPGFKQPGNSKIAYPNWNIGGYPQVKYYPLTSDQIDLGGGQGYSDNPVFRLGETYLIYAEAKAELGTLTQADLDRTISLLRARVGLPAPVLADWLAKIDPRLEKMYPNVSGPQKGAILEIRRERRVELACEGFRLDDLKRWKVATLAAVTPVGMYIGQLGAVDITGDSIPEFYLSQDGEGFDKEQAEYPDNEIFEYKLSTASFDLTEGDKGNIQVKVQVNAFSFPDKYYYWPLSTQDLLVNPNLKQNPFWK
ncbi:MAG: RagB/SusD family nutrient uptake outer membrane protein [Tannerella sp.]|jgi:hypothetical protein|nr:RagB/SusD family nutrient uptake outer membrane protein [Tannerella sp.]